MASVWPHCRPGACALECAGAPATASHPEGPSLLAPADGGWSVNQLLAAAPERQQMAQCRITTADDRRHHRDVMQEGLPGLLDGRGLEGDGAAMLGAKFLSG
ncbi:hypothetical protein [Synechococcus sp. MU1643]|uniref:hypothetical protein n=1 Tax=Synechococcus sp. MU1643 TaxID=2508349 RepID=UPI001CF89ADD|nr:hypothetical protein [Synechococcus sp. MU1643]